MQVSLLHLIPTRSINRFPYNLPEQLCCDCIVDYKMTIFHKTAADQKDSI